MYQKSHCCKHILTGEQNFKIKTHHSLKINSAEQYEAQIILIGCCRSNGKNVIKFHKISPFSLWNCYETFYWFKTDAMQLKKGKKYRRYYFYVWEDLHGKAKNNIKSTITKWNQTMMKIIIHLRDRETLQRDLDRIRELSHHQPYEIKQE